MSANHTPGPWETSCCIPRGSADAQWDVCMVGGGDRIATVDDIDPAETEANARLISAAPDLLAALQEAHGFIMDRCFEYNEPDERADKLADQIEAAIAKAGAAP